MLWKQLGEFIKSRKELDDEACYIYDEASGEFYTSEIIEFEDGDEIIESGAVFIRINTDEI